MAIKGRKPGVKTTPENETKDDKFIRLADKRVNKVLKGLRSIKNLSAPAYGRNQDQIDTIIKALTLGVNDVNDAFILKGKPEATKFRLSDTVRSE